MRNRCIAIMLALQAVAAGSNGIGPSPDAIAPVAASSSRGHPSGAMRDYGMLPLIFERTPARDGEVDRYIARGANYAIAVSTDGAQLALRSPAHAADAVFAPLAIRFVGASPDATIAGAKPLETRIHRIRRGDPRDDIDAPTYGAVAVRSLYPGIDVLFHGRGRELEYDVIVAPGGDAAQFAFRIDESAHASLTEAGDLMLDTPAGTLMLRRPVAWQDVEGKRRGVASEFVLTGERDVRIRMGAYDRGRVLVIDPVVSYATWLGGNSFDQGTAIAVDEAGNAYVAGYTLSSDFPTVNAFDRSFSRKGDVDVFVSKLNAAGTALVWSTYLGGSGGTDRAIGIAIDASGSAYITGSTSGTDFPTSATAWQKALTGGGAFVAKLGPAGNTLVYSTYVAGAASNSIAVDAAGNAYVTGSATPAFITTPGALQPTPRNAAGTAFVLKLNATGSAPLFATFLGGSGSEEATSIALDAYANAYVAGWTTSGDFPVVNAFQSAPRGYRDAFVAKLDNTGARLVYSTLLGGGLDDAINAIAVDGPGNAYIAGETYSSDFPVKDGFQMYKAGFRLINASVGNAFVGKLSATGNALVYASFLGGEVCLSTCQLVFGPQLQFRADAAYGIAVDAAGHAYVTGIARSYTFPLVDSTATRKQDSTDDSAFVAKVGIPGNVLLWSTFTRTGFNESDNKWTRFPPGAATGVAVDSTGAAYVTGDADQYSNFQPTAGASQTTSADGQGAVIVKFAPAPALSLATSNASVDTQTPIRLTATLSGPATSGVVTFLDAGAWIGQAALAANTATLTLTLPAGIHALSAIMRLPGVASDTPVLYQIVDVPLSCN